MKKYKIKFKALSFGGNMVNKTLQIEMPEFQEKTETFIVNGNKFNFTIGVESQVLDYLDSVDKRYIMDDNDWAIIIDYKLFVPKPKMSKVDKISAFKSLVINYFNPNFEHADKLRDDVMVVYIKMYDKIKDLTPEQQFMIVLGTLDVGYAAQSEAYKHVTDMLKSDVPQSLKKLGKNQNKLL
jgi:hypothetical protein